MSLALEALGRLHEIKEEMQEKLKEARNLAARIEGKAGRKRWDKDCMRPLEKKIAELEEELSNRQTHCDA